MQLSRIALGIVAMLVLGWSLPAGAAAPPSMKIVYRIHEDANDADSPVKLEFTITANRETLVGSAGGWKIAYIEFRQPGTEGSADKMWYRAAPPVGTADGLWWITHSDTDSPQRAEFAKLPPLAGVAAPLAPITAELSYNLTGGNYVPPPEGPPFAITGAARYAFAAALPGFPIDDPGWDEPIDIPPTPSGGGTS